jgi:hypothetical protein
MTRRNATVVVATLATCLALSSVASASRRSDEETLRHLKEVLWPRAYAEQDVALLNSILADEFQMVDGDGNWSTKAAELEYVRKNKPGYESLVFAVKRLDLFENGTAIVAGEGTVIGRDDGGPYVATYQSTNVLIKRGGSWKAIASHVSGFKRADRPARR